MFNNDKKLLIMILKTKVEIIGKISFSERKFSQCVIIIFQNRIFYESKENNMNSNHYLLLEMYSLFVKKKVTLTM